MTPLQKYYQQLDSKHFLPDPAQAKAMIALNTVYEQLSTEYLYQTSLRRLPFWRKFQFPFWRKFHWSKLRKLSTIKGMYLWGGVGAGKTWLMDNFYSCLPASISMRLHFHRFMHTIHQQLKQWQGHANPLQKIAQALAKQTKIICLDEFFVNDITDAMLLANLLTALYQQGIVIITTSNVTPDDLYKNGLQRGNFLPAIELIKQHMTIWHIESQMDYRLRTLTQTGVYFYPLNTLSAQQIHDCYEQMSHHNYIKQQILQIHDRPIPTIACAPGVAWFDFNDLCHVPRSQLDYLEIAQQFHTVFVSNIPIIKAEQDDLITYLINLVDVFYDANVNLIISADASLTELYPEGRKVFEFERTRSRLIEMQSAEYLAKAHFYS